MSDESSPTSFLAVVRGRVQGVGFRAFTARQAERLSLQGTVRNLPDGSVEVLASGSREGLDALLAALEKGPILSRVTAVQTRWGVPVDSSGGFRITS